jgi:cytochrome c oxidase subunit II
MPIVVEVKTQADYDKWLAVQKDKYGVGKVAAPVIDTKVYTKEELLAHGKTVYEGIGGCVGCHQPTGKGVPGQFAALDGSKIVASKDNMIAMLLNGKPGTAMASFKHLSDKDLAAVSDYVRNSWGNSASELIQPIDFAKARFGGKLPEGAVVAGDAKPADAKPADAAKAPASSSALPAKIYFATGKKELPGDAKESIDAALAFLKGKADAKVDITGFTDKTGNRDANLELAKERAKAVRTALEAAGIAKDRINMKPPAEITGGADDKEARRVEINPA